MNTLRMIATLSAGAASIAPIGAGLYGPFVRNTVTSALIGMAVAKLFQNVVRP